MLVMLAKGDAKYLQMGQKNCEKERRLGVQTEPLKNVTRSVVPSAPLVSLMTITNIGASWECLWERRMESKLGWPRRWLSGGKRLRSSWEDIRSSLKSQRATGP